jgi:hypothetical protein
MTALGQELPRRSLTDVTGLRPIPAAPSHAWGGGYGPIATLRTAPIGDHGYPFQR